MPRLKLTKSAVDALPTPDTDTVYSRGQANRWLLRPYH
jgi:hypothetical protein